MRVLLKKLKLFFYCIFTQIPSVYAECDYVTDPFCEDTDLPLDTNITFLIIVVCTLSALKILKIKQHRIDQIN